jgi:ribonuclease HII
MVQKGSRTTDARYAGVRDSKQLAAPQRRAAADVIRSVAIAIGAGIVEPLIVDEFGLSAAGQLAFWRAVQALGQRPNHLLVDGFPLWSRAFQQTAVIHGDAYCLSIAAASIIAKVTRDQIMTEVDALAPGYGFSHNVGYGTTVHAEALRRLGPTPYHRRSYEPVGRLSEDIGLFDDTDLPDA